MLFILALIPDFIEIPLLALLDLLFLAAWITFVVFLPGRILGPCVWSLVKVLLFVSAFPIVLHAGSSFTPNPRLPVAQSLLPVRRVLVARGRDGRAVAVDGEFPGGNRVPTM